MTEPVYPYALSKEVLKLRAALRNAGAQSTSILTKVGTYYKFAVYDSSNSQVFVSEEVPELSRLFRRAYIRALAIRLPFRVVITKIIYSGSNALRSVDVEVPHLLKLVKSGAFVTLPHRLPTKKRLLLSRTPGFKKNPRPPFQQGSHVRPSPETHSANIKHLVISNGVLTVNTVDTYNTFERTWSGSVTPGFRTKRASNLPVNDHHSLTKRTYDLGMEVSHMDLNSLNTGSPDFVITLSSWSSLLGTGQAGVSPPDPSHLALARNKAIKALVDACGTGLDANLAQDLAQFRQTAATISDSVKRISSSVIALKKGNIPLAISSLWDKRPHHPGPRFAPKHAPSPTKSVANNWLCLQYGWKPLLQDINGACRSLANYLERDPSVRSVRVKASHTVVSRQALTRNSTPFTVVGDAIMRTHTTCKIGMRYKVSSPATAFFAQTGFNNPVNLAWEILPFSFVLDWILPIGPFLEGLSSFDGLEFVDGWQVQFTRENILRSCNYSGYPSFAWYNEQYVGGFQREAVLLDRIKLTTFPSLSFPSLKNPLSSIDHVANGLALLRSAFR